MVSVISNFFINFFSCRIYPFIFLRQIATRNEIFNFYAGRFTFFFVLNNVHKNFIANKTRWVLKKKTLEFYIC